MSTRNSTEVVRVRYKNLRFMGYENYRVGDDGSVWSKFALGGVRLKKGWRRSKPTDDGGRMLVNLRVNGKSKTHTVSRLVLLAFVGECPEGMECCHNNGDHRDNRLSNLRWDTHSSNEKDKKNHGTSHFHHERHYGAKLTVDEVREIRRLYATGEYSLTKLGKMFKVFWTTVHPIVQGRTWKGV